MATTITSETDIISNNNADGNNSTANKNGASITLRLGWEVDNVFDLAALLKDSLALKFDFIVVPLVHPLYRRRVAAGQNPTTSTVSAFDGAVPLNTLPLTRSDLVLSSDDWRAHVVGKISEWISFESPLERVRRQARDVLHQELAWASHLSVCACVLPTISWECQHYASTVLAALARFPYMTLWVRVPLLLSAPAHRTVLHSTERSTNLSSYHIEQLRRASDAWECWNRFRTLCEHHPSLGVALELTPDLIPTVSSFLSSRNPVDSQLPVGEAEGESVSEETRSHLLDYVISRWRGEPVRTLILPTSIFLTNAKGYPVLSKRHQRFVRSFFPSAAHVSFVISGSGLLATPTPKPSSLSSSNRSTAVDTTANPIATSSIDPFQKPITSALPPSSASKKGGPSPPVPSRAQSVSVYQQYLAHLARIHPPLSELEVFEQPYWDYLQTPLQPLMDHLESSIYDTFEKDPHKYALYERAINVALHHESALIDKRQRVQSLTEKMNDVVRHTMCLAEPDPSLEVIIVVLGAGRGPLVQCALQAATQARALARVFAIEKNPHAVVTLRNRVYAARLKLAEKYRSTDDWIALHNDWAHVTVFEGDARTWTPPSGVTLPKADLVVSEMLGSFGDNESSPECLATIDRFLAPHGLSIPRDSVSYLTPICSEKLYNEVKSFNDFSHFETAYVVKLHNVHLLAEPQPCFVFYHPTPPHLKDNSRYACLEFKMRESTMIHGLAGYFESTLYENAKNPEVTRVTLSIHPRRHTKGMFSWFPIYFPIRFPVYVPHDTVVTVHFWRYVDTTHVWYEWCVETPHTTTPIHNSNGRSYYIGL
jgi:protein arginine N-methyltransferase 5